MRILITGHEGFVGRNLKEALENNHKIFTLEKSESFDVWKDKVQAVVSEPVDVIVHSGAISSTQYQHPDIFLWNAQATKYLFEKSILKSNSPYFIFFFDIFGRRGGERFASGQLLYLVKVIRRTVY